MRWIPGQKLDQIEKEVILDAYKYCNYNKTKTAAALGIAIRTLDNKLARYEEHADHSAKPDFPTKQIASGN